MSAKRKRAFSPKKSIKKFLRKELSFRRKNAVKIDANMDIRREGIFLAKPIRKELILARSDERLSIRASKSEEIIPSAPLETFMEEIFPEIKGSAFEKASPFCENAAISRIRWEKSALKIRKSNPEIIIRDKAAQREGGSSLLRRRLRGFAARKRKYPAIKGAATEKM